MRWVRDMILVLGLAFVGLGFTGTRKEERSRDALIESAVRQTRDMEQMIKCRAAAKTGELNQRGWPVTIEPAWFEQSPPTNPLLDGHDHPWVEIAPASDAALQHPPVRIAVGPGLAQFWYNPYQGIIRARVPVMVSDDLTVQAYNQINGTRLATIFDHEKSTDSALSLAGASARDTDSNKRDANPMRRSRASRSEPLVRVHHASAEADATPD